MHQLFDFEIAYYLYKISKILSIFEDNKYRAEAYFRAAMAIDAYDRQIASLVAENNIDSIVGIGNSSAKIIKEVVETGKSSLLEELEQKYGVEDYSLILVSGISNGIIKKLYDRNIKSFLDLSNQKHHLIDLGFSKTEYNKIIDFIEKYSQSFGWYLYSYAYCLSSEMEDFLNEDYEIAISKKDLPWNKKVKFAVLNCLSNKKNEILDRLLKNNRYHDIEVFPNYIICKTAFGLPIKLVFVEKLNYANSSKILRGDLHMHTNWSDGTHNIVQMVERARELGLEYIGITDHTYSLHVANGLSEVDVIQQIHEIRELQKQGTKIFAGIEVEILKDGTLDFSDDILSNFDYVIAGIHTNLNQNYVDLKRRLEKALSNPYVNIFAHPTSRTLGKPGVMFSDRGPYTVKIDEIIDICKRNNVIIEFNCFPERFDIDPSYFKDIIDKGVMLSVGSDSHSTLHLNCLQFAEEAIKKEPSITNNILNMSSFSQVENYFQIQRKSKLKSIVQEVHRSEIKDFHHFFGNNINIMDGNFVSVGIDLTGSEDKPSGWAVLKGKNVQTEMLMTDEDIIKRSFEFNPKVVSIDSPLSHPYKDIGITRYCERVLASFGIHAYPCLIPSMVNLTNRGIRLAEKFRNLGIEVIESYPGAAQDILSIRRKQNGLTHLKNGYKSFGIIGNYYDSEMIKHDELDAIMSALVGYFYINNQYVALGNDDENYLIVPSVAKKIEPRIIIGLAGEISVGKTTLAEYLKFKYGFKTLRYSQIICDLYNCNYDRTVLQNLGEEIASDEVRQRALSLEIIRRINLDEDSSYVIDGLRHEMDYKTLNSYFGDRFKLIYIDSTSSKRYNRYTKNNKEISKEEFGLMCNRKSENDIFLLRFASNFIIKNDNTYKEFFDKFELLLKEILCQ